MDLKVAIFVDFFCLLVLLASSYMRSCQSERVPKVNTNTVNRLSV